MAWEPVAETYAVKAGEFYRVGVQIKAPFSEALSNVIKLAIKAGVGLKNLNPFQDLHNKVEIRSIYHVMPSVSTRTGRSETWWIYTEFMKRGPNPVLPVIYGLIALIVVASTAVLVAGRSFERFTDQVGSDFGGAVDKVFNPGVVLAAFVLGFLFLKSRA